MPVSKILKTKTAEEIKFPEAKVFVLGEQSFPVLPMPDGVLVKVTQELGAVVGLLVGASTKSKERMDALKARQTLGEDVSEEEIKAAQVRLTDFTYSDLAAFVPQIIQVLLPGATKIIAASLRQSEQWVEDNLFYRDRLRALRLILEAEDIPVLVGEAKALAGVFQPTILSPEPAPTTS